MPAKYARKAPKPPPKKRRRGTATTTIQEYDDEEFEFIKAMDKFKREKRRPFPTWSEVLQVLKELGWKKEDEGR